MSPPPAMPAHDRGDTVATVCPAFSAFRIWAPAPNPKIRVEPRSNGARGSFRKFLMRAAIYSVGATLSLARRHSRSRRGLLSCHSPRDFYPGRTPQTDLTPYQEPVSACRVGVEQTGIDYSTGDRVPPAAVESLLSHWHRRQAPAETAPGVRWRDVPPPFPQLSAGQSLIGEKRDHHCLRGTHRR